MDVENPYAAPQAELGAPLDEARDSDLAGRFTRLASAIVDGWIGMAIAFPLMYALGIWTYIGRGQNPPLGLMLASGALSFLGFFLIHGYFLKTKGQTVGKKLAGIRIAALDGSIPDFATVVLRRYLPISIVAQIPAVGPYLTLLDVLFIFRGDRRCIHDLIAGTKVVKIRKASQPTAGPDGF
jgi:uncharacterized RDD family membrane protein YckC